MKKIGRILILLIVALSSIFFVSCKDPYSSMSLTVEATNGKINLTLDEDKPTLKTAVVDVVFSGIDKKTNKDVIAYTIPSELATVKKLDFTDKGIKLEITAVSAGDNGKLYVASAANSKKFTEIPISVTQTVKSIFAADKKNYAVEILDGTTNSFEIPASAFRVFPEGANEKLTYTAIGSLPYGVEISGNKIFVSPNANEGVFSIYGHTLTVNNRQSTTQFINIELVKMYQDLNIKTSAGQVLFSDETTKELYLISNKYDKILSGIYKDLYLNQTEIKIYDGTFVLDSTRYITDVKTYSIIDGVRVNYEGNKSGVVEVTASGQNSAVIKAVTNTSANIQAYVEINVDLANYMGQFTKKIIIKVNVLTAPTGFIVKEDGEMLTGEIVNGVQTINTKIFDVYKSQYGAKYQISMSPAQVYLNDEFDFDIVISKNCISQDNFASLNKNKYVLEFKQGNNNYIQFFELDSNYVYANISSFYLTYKEIEGATNLINPSFRIESRTKNLKNIHDIYSPGNLSNAKCELVFQPRIGVNNIYFDQTNHPNGIVACPFNPETQTTPENPLYLRATDIKGNSANVDITYSVSNADGILLYRTDIADRVYRPSITVSNSYGIVGVVGLGVGEYRVTATAENGKSAYIIVKVYVPFTNDSIEIVLPQRADYGNIAAIQKIDNYVQLDVSTESLLKINFKRKYPETNISFKVDYIFTDSSWAALSYSPTKLSVLSEQQMLRANFPTYANIKEEILAEDFVYLIIKVTGVTGFENGVEHYDTNIFVEQRLKVFIYRPIQSINLTYTSYNVTAKSTLGITNQDNAKLALTATITPSDAWLSKGADGKYLSWTQADSIGDYGQYLKVLDQKDNSITYIFDLPQPSVNNKISSAKKVVWVQVQQYSQSFIKTCEVFINRAKQAERIIFTNNFQKQKINDKYIPYIYLRADKGINESNWQEQSVESLLNTYKINAKVYPYDGVYDREILYFVVKKNADSPNVNNIVGIKNGYIVPLAPGEVVIYVVPRDALKEKLDSIYINDVNFDPYQYFKVFDDVGETFEKINLKIADGSISNPYYISTFEDLAQMDNPNGLISHYVLVNDIDANGRYVTPIGLGSDNGFVGSIRSWQEDYENPTRTFGIYNIGLNQLNYHTFASGQKQVTVGLFSKIGVVKNSSGEIVSEGQIENVKFSFLLDFKNSINFTNTKQDYYQAPIYVAGLTAINSGIIKDCQVEISSSLDTNNNINPLYILYSVGEFYFGGLAGYNSGSIIFTNELAAASKITAKIKLDNLGIQTMQSIGGAVGANDGLVQGVYLHREDYVGTIDYTAVFGNAGALADVNIEVESSNTNFANNEIANNQNKITTLGGVIGYNKGRLLGAYSCGMLKGKYNVGGIIGYNVGERSVTVGGNTVLIDKDTDSDYYQVKDSYTSVMVTAEANAGGVVGFTKGGSFYYVNSEYYNDEYNTLEDFSIVAQNNVGGFAGIAYKTIFNYCFVVSYKTHISENGKLDYSNYAGDIRLLKGQSATSNATNLFAGGLIGYSYDSDVNACSANIKIVTDNLGLLTKNVYAGGIIGAYQLDKFGTDAGEALIDVIENTYAKGIISLLSGEETNTNYYFFGLSGDFLNADKDKSRTLLLDRVYSVISFAQLNESNNYLLFNIGNKNALSRYHYYIKDLGNKYEVRDEYGDFVCDDINCYKFDFDDSGFNSEDYSEGEKNYFLQSNHLINEGFRAIRNPYSNDDNPYGLSVEMPLSIEISTDVLNKALYYMRSNGYPPIAIDKTDSSLNMLILRMYNLITGADQNITNEQLGKDKKSLNTILFEQLLAVNVSPVTDRVARLAISSSNDSVLGILDGSFIMKKTGSTNIIVSSKLNSQIRDTLSIQVQDATDYFSLYKSANISDESFLLSNGEVINLGVGATTFVIANFSNVITVENEDSISHSYVYHENQLSGIKYSISTAYDDFIRMNNNWTTADGMSYIRLDKGNIAFIEAIKNCEYNINISAIPYIKILKNGEYHYIDFPDMAKPFSINTYVGATKLSIDYTSLSISPLTDTDFNITVATDKDDDNIYIYSNELKEYLNFDSSDGKLEFELAVQNDAFPFDIMYERDYDYENDTLSFCLHFFVKSDKKLIKDVSNWSFEVSVESGYINNLKAKTFSISLVPQEILHMNIKNYSYRAETIEYINYFITKQTVKVTPGARSLLKVSLYPEFSDYDYLKITNTNNRYIASMWQVLYNPDLISDGYLLDGVNSPYVNTFNQSQIIPNGIRLDKLQYVLLSTSYIEKSVSTLGEFYVNVLIPSKDALGEMLREGDIFELIVEACRYDSNGREEVLGVGAKIELEVQIEPNIEMTYTDVLGKETVSTQNNSATINVATGIDFSINYLANKTESVLFELYRNNIKVTNLTNILSYNTSSVQNGITGRIDINMSSFDIGDNIKIRIVGSRTIENIETTNYTEMTFIVRKFVINGISIKNNVNGTMNLRYNESYALSAQFIGDDYSVSEANRGDCETVLKNFADSINNILTDSEHWYIRNRILADDYRPIQDGTYSNVNMKKSTENNLTYISSSNSSGSANDIMIKLYYNYNINNIPALTNSIANDKILVSSETTLSFSMPQSIQSAIPVYDEADFMGMEANKKYILMNNIEFANYVPVNKALLGFDGNGYVVSIKNYYIPQATAAAPIAELNLGLFEVVYENMIVSNVILNIADRSIDLSHVVRFNYGGIAVTNRGIITNCTVKAKSVNAATLLPTTALYSDIYSGTENKNGLYIYQTTPLVSGAVTKTTVAGLVATNETTGYITNSKVLYSIVGFGDIAGFVGYNKGVIASSKYQYGSIKNNSVRGVESITAGFALNNSNKITLSYSEGTYPYNTSNISNRDDYLRALLGGIECKNNATGFTYYNSGKINDCYANIYIKSNGITSGFVFENKNVISRSFSSTKLAESEFYTPFVGTDSNREPLSTKDNIQSCFYLVSGSDANPFPKEPAKPVYATQNKNYNISYMKFYDELNMADLKLGADVIKDNVTDIKLNCFEEDSYDQFAFISGNDKNGNWKFERVSSTISYNRLKLVSADMIFSVKQKLSKVTTLENGETEYSYVADGGEVIGSALNPYLIYDALSYNTYMNAMAPTSSIVNAYRLVKDIDMAELNGRPITTDKTFYGILEGNNMKIFNLSIYDWDQTGNLTSVGLFKEISSISSAQADRGYVKNLIITPLSVYATNTSCVGTLAGVLNKGYVSSVTIDAPSNVVVVGHNTVGGMFGIMRGDFEAKGLYSNVSVNSSFRNPKAGKYSVYRRYYYRGLVINNNEISYAGSIAGVVDGFVTGSECFNNGVVANRIQRIKYAGVTGSVYAVGENVGFAFGFVGESSIVDNIRCIVGSTSSANGVYYSGGLVGENRGKINRSYISYSKNILALLDAQNVETAVPNLTNKKGVFINFASVANCNVTLFNKTGIAGGIAGFNNGGLLSGVVSRVAVTNEKTNTAGGLIGLSTLGGIEYGYTTSSVYSSLFIGGAIGRLTTASKLTNINDVVTVEGNNIRSVLADSTKSVASEYSAEVCSRFVLNNVIANNYWEAKYTIIIRKNIEETEETVVYRRFIGGLISSIQGFDNEGVFDKPISSMVWGNKFNNKIYLDKKDILPIENFVYTYQIQSYRSIYNGGVQVTSQRNDVNSELAATKIYP